MKWDNTWNYRVEACMSWTLMLRFFFNSKTCFFFTSSAKIPQENKIFFKKQTFNVFDDQRNVTHESVL